MPISNEVLRHSSRKDYLPYKEMRKQKQALTALVSQAQKRLLEQSIDRDPDRKDPAQKRFDSFFSLPDDNAVLTISCLGGTPELYPSGAMFIYIHQKGPDEIKPQELVGIQTVKSPDSIEEKEVLWLSGYKPEQIDLITQAISSAQPMEKNQYDVFMGRRKMSVAT